MVQQHDTEFLKNQWLGDKYPDGQVECHVRLKWLGPAGRIRISFVDPLGNELVHYDPVDLKELSLLTIKNVRLIQGLTVRTHKTEESVMSEGNEKNPVYEVLFTYDAAKVGGKKGETEKKVLGPFYYPAKNSTSAMVQGVLANYKDLIKGKILSIDPKVKRF